MTLGGRTLLEGVNYQRPLTKRVNRAWGALLEGDRVYPGVRREKGLGPHWDVG